jgi:hypothetical protein
MQPGNTASYNQKARSYSLDHVIKSTGTTRALKGALRLAAQRQVREYLHLDA